MVANVKLIGRGEIAGGGESLFHFVVEGDAGVFRDKEGEVVTVVDLIFGEIQALVEAHAFHFAAGPGAVPCCATIYDLEVGVGSVIVVVFERGVSGAEVLPSGLSGEEDGDIVDEAVVAVDDVDFAVVDVVDRTFYENLVGVAGVGD